MRSCRMASALAAALLLAAGAASAQLAPGDVLVTSVSSGQVYRLDPSAPAPTAPVVVPPDGAIGAPRGLAEDRNGQLLVTADGPKTLFRVDPSQDLRALAAQFSTVLSALRGIGDSIPPGNHPFNLLPTTGQRFISPASDFVFTLDASGFLELTTVDPVGSAAKMGDRTVMVGSP